MIAGERWILVVFSFGRPRGTIGTPQPGQFVSTCRRGVTQRHKVSQGVAKVSHMCHRNVTRCHEVSRKCHMCVTAMSQGVTECHQVSQEVARGCDEVRLTKVLLDRGSLSGSSALQVSVCTVSIVLLCHCHVDGCRTAAINSTPCSISQRLGGIRNTGIRRVLAGSKYRNTEYGGCMLQN